MSLDTLPVPEPNPVSLVRHARIRLRTAGSLQFIDVTERVEDEVQRAGLLHGTVNVQTRHTTTAVIVNENEPLLIEDLKQLLRGWAPRERPYRHDDMSVRIVNLVPGERPNGHAHARALLLGSSETLNVVGGALDLGRWQRIFFVELDGPRERTLSLTVMGQSTPDRARGLYTRPRRPLEAIR